ncbi:MAG: hypothetical protein WBF17_16950 [Phycisphaerae bacterium]
MLKRTLLSGVCCLVLCATCLAEQRRIKLKNGRVFVGDVIERTDEGIKVKGRIAVVFYKHDQIESIEPVSDPKLDFVQRLAGIDKTSAEAHVKLGQWAMERKLYKEAVACFKGALAVEKGHERASLLLRQAQARLKKSTGAAGTGDTDNGDDDTGIGAVPFEPKLLVKREDVYRIRLEELRKDERVSVRFRNDVIERFIRQMGGTGDFREEGFARKFRRLPTARQAMYILAKADRDDKLKDDIVIRTDPAFMREFRATIWPTVAGSCGSINCHGSAKGKGKLKLFNVAGRNVNVDYTNFLILDSFHKKGGMFMIRRDNWEKSLLLQYGLPESQAEYRHPVEKKPVFPSRESLAYRQTLEWIKKLKSPLHPDYRIQDRPPNVMAPPAGLPGLQMKTPATGPATKSKSPF